MQMIACRLYLLIGTSKHSNDLFYRIPLGDNLLEITASLPENELTSVLRDFRRYRPPTQREYIESVEARARLAKVKAFANADAKSLALYVLNVDQVGKPHTDDHL